MAGPSLGFLYDDTGKLNLNAEVECLCWNKLQALKETWFLMIENEFQMLIYKYSQLS
jgi:hypothetical protein